MRRPCPIRGEGRALFEGIPQVKTRIVIITGLSGSGKTVAIRAIEDSGFVCVDNIPPELIDSLATTIADKNGADRIAVGVDIREKDFLDTIEAALPKLREKYTISILFLEADNDILLRRFKETRRPHPLMTTGIRDIEEALDMERSLLAPLRDDAEKIIDTSSLTPHQLRRMMRGLFDAGPQDESMGIRLISFGFKFGMPQNVDLVFDVRFLPNPHFVPELKELDGKMAPVRDYVLSKQACKTFLDKLEGMLDFLIPNYMMEGKSYLTIGIGCTGGRHRSVAVTEEMARRLGAKSFKIEVVHREI